MNVNDLGLKEWWFLICCIVLATVPVYFVVHKVYQDGFIGRVFLCGISFCAFSWAMELLLSDAEYDLLPLHVLNTTCVAGFFVWHLWRFERRVLRAEKQYGRRVTDSTADTIPGDFVR